MRLLSLLSVVLASPLANALTYHLHKSCTNDLLTQPGYSGNRWEALFDEVQTAGANGVKRMINAFDTNYQRAFNYVFQIADKNARVNFQGTKEDLIFKYFIMLRGLETGESQERSNIIIYCDNDERWTPKEEGQGEGGFKDEVNHMSTLKRGCKDEGPGVAAVTYVDHQESAGETIKATITLCNALFEKGKNINGRGSGRWLFGDIPDVQFRDDEESIRWVGFTVTSMLMHELAHVQRAETIDVLGANSYGWEQITEHICSDCVWNNADNYSYAAIMALLADRGVVLDPEPNLAKLGILVRK